MSFFFHGPEHFLLKCQEEDAFAWGASGGGEGGRRRGSCWYQLHLAFRNKGPRLILFPSPVQKAQRSPGSNLFPVMQHLYPQGINIWQRGRRRDYIYVIKED